MHSFQYTKAPFIKSDHIAGLNTSLEKYQKINRVQIRISSHSTIRLEKKRKDNQAFHVICLEIKSTNHRQYFQTIIIILVNTPIGQGRKKKRKPEKKSGYDKDMQRVNMLFFVLHLIIFGILEIFQNLKRRKSMY